MATTATTMMMCRYCCCIWFDWWNFFSVYVQFASFFIFFFFSLLLLLFLIRSSLFYCTHNIFFPLAICTRATFSAVCCSNGFLFVWRNFKHHIYNIETRRLVRLHVWTHACFACFFARSFFDFNIFGGRTFILLALVCFSLLRLCVYLLFFVFICRSLPFGWFFCVCVDGRMRERILFFPDQLVSRE